MEIATQQAVVHLHIKHQGLQLLLENTPDPLPQKQLRRQVRTNPRPKSW
jgi:hypothetical protein